MGPTKVIDHTVRGLKIADLWLNTAKVMDQIVVIRSMTGIEPDHSRATSSCTLLNVFCLRRCLMSVQNL